MLKKVREVSEKKKIRGRSRKMEDEGTGERNKPREGSLRYLLPRRTCQPRLARQRADSESARQNERRVARLPCLLFCYPCRPVRDDNGENDHRSKHGSTWYQRHLPSKDDASTLDASCLQHPILFPSLLVPTVTLFFFLVFFLLSTHPRLLSPKYYY